MNEWKTPKGTTLYLLDLKGKPYLPVAERLIWFREEHPDWNIETELVVIGVDNCLAKARIKTPDGQHIASAHKFETKQGFADFIEKSETGAIGRALAMCGYGTQFCADDFNEGERLADAPRNVTLHAHTPIQETKFDIKIDNSNSLKTNKPNVPFKVPDKFAKINAGADSVIPFGKSKGMKFSEVGIDGVYSALNWLETKAAPKYRESDSSQAFIKAAKAYLGDKPKDDVPPAPPMPTEFDAPAWPEQNDEIPF